MKFDPLWQEFSELDTMTFSADTNGEKEMAARRETNDEREALSLIVGDVVVPDLCDHEVVFPRGCFAILGRQPGRFQANK